MKSWVGNVFTKISGMSLRRLAPGRLKLFFLVISKLRDYI